MRIKISSINSKHITPDKKATAYALTTVLFWSTVATAFKIGLRTLDPAQLIFIATIVTVILLFVFLLATGKIKKLFALPAKRIIYAALLGLLNPFLYYLILFKAYTLLPAQVAQPLNMIWPIVLVLLAIPMLKQKIGIRSILALLISLMGVFILSSQGEFFNLQKSNPTGLLLCIGSAFVWALYWILSVKNRDDQLIKLFISFLAGMIYLLIYIALFSTFKININSSLYAGVYIGIFEVGLSFILWMKALSYSSSSARIANLIYITPFLSLLFIHFILAEKIHSTTLLGLFFIISGVLFQQTDKRNKTSTVQKPSIEINQKEQEKS
jgi:drug/metabolite transporter (DMT)-like permease